MTSLSANSTRTFLGLPHSITTSYVTKPLPSSATTPSKNIQNKSPPMNGVSITEIHHHNIPIVIITSLKEATYIRFRVLDIDFNKEYEMILPMIQLRSALLGLDADATSPSEFLIAVHDLVLIKASPLDRNIRTLEIVLNGTSVDPSKTTTNDTNNDNRNPNTDLKYFTNDRDLVEKYKNLKKLPNSGNTSIAGSIQSLTVSVRSSERNSIKDRNCIVVAGPCSDPRLKCQGFCVLEENLDMEHMIRLQNGHYIKHKELIAYPKCYRCKRGSGWHLPTEEEVQEKVKDYNERRNASSTKNNTRSRSPSDNETDVDIICLAGICTTKHVDCNGFSIARSTLLPEHIKKLNTTTTTTTTNNNNNHIHKNKNKNKNKNYLLHSELLCYPKCWHCGRGPGWHLPSELEIQERLFNKPTRKMILNEKEKQRRNNVEIDSNQGKRVVRISGPCSDPRVHCRGFLLYEMQLYRDHLSFLTGDAVQVNGRHLTQGEILEYNGILCLDCNLGPGWHLPAETDVYSISPLGNRRKSVSNKMNQLQCLLDGSWKQEEGNGENNGENNGVNNNQNSGEYKNNEMDELYSIDSTVDDTWVIDNEHNLRVCKKESSIKDGGNDGENGVVGHDETKLDAFLTESFSKTNEISSRRQEREEMLLRRGSIKERTKARRLKKLNQKEEEKYQKLKTQKANTNASNYIQEENSITSTTTITSQNMQEEHRLLSTQIDLYEINNQKNKTIKNQKIEILRNRLTMLDEISKNERSTLRID